MCPGARPANDISIEFKIRPKFRVLQFKICSTAQMFKMFPFDDVIM